MTTTTFKAAVKSAPSKTMSKSNGSDYVLINVELLDGPAKGKIVAATRTIKNVDGKEKSVPAIGEEVTLYHQVLPSTQVPGKFVHFFEISTGMVSASNDELTALLGTTVQVGQAI
jgi:hypothetical protein